MNKIKEHVDNFKIFIEHNLQLGYINKENTIEEFLRFLNNVEQFYLPIVEQIDILSKSKTLSKDICSQDKFKCKECGEIFSKIQLNHFSDDYYCDAEVCDKCYKKLKYEEQGRYLDSM